MAAAHLNPSLIGSILGMTHRKVAPIEQILRKEGVRSNHFQDQWTGVSLQRWKDLVLLTDDEDMRFLTTSMWLNALWETSRDKSGLLEFILAMERAMGEAILHNDELGNALRHDYAAQQEWAAKTFEPTSLTADAVTRALDDVITLPLTDPAWSTALEVTCASMATQHAYKPAIAPGKYGHDGGAPKSDCVEMTVRELMDLLLWDETSGNFDLARLPQTALPQLVDLYNQNSDGAKWFQLLSNLPGCDYLSSSPNGTPYELTPTMANIANVTRILLLGVNDDDDQRTVTLDGLATIWTHAPLNISTRISRHRPALGDEMVNHEIANISLQGGKNGIEMRLDKAHGICTVTHLRQQTSSLDTRLTPIATSTEPAIQILALAMAGDSSRLDPNLTKINTLSSTDLLLQLMATPFGPDRRGLLHVIETSDLGRRERDLNQALRESQEVIRHALSEICKLRGNPELQKQLLLWILRETPSIIDDESIQLQNPDPRIETMLLALPSEILKDDAFQEALHCNWAVRGKIVTRLVELQLGIISKTNLWHDLTLEEMVSMVLLHARCCYQKIFLEAQKGSTELQIQ
jgi:hypothetical protein